MIPADHITIDGDTALVVKSPFDSTIPSFEPLDRPCDDCDGQGERFVDEHGSVWGDTLAEGLGLTERIVCVACDGSGHHAFTVEVKTPGGHNGDLHQGVGWSGGTRTLRVHVIDVLPPDEWWPRCDCPTCPSMNNPQRKRHYLTCTLPSAAEPGMWLVRLGVHA